MPRSKPLYAFNQSDAAALLGLIGKSPGSPSPGPDFSRFRFAKVSVVAIEATIDHADVSSSGVIPASGQARLWRRPKRYGEHSTRLCEHAIIGGKKPDPITLYNPWSEKLLACRGGQGKALVLAAADIWGDWFAIEAIVRPARWIQFSTTADIGTDTAVTVTTFWDGADPALFWENVTVANSPSGRFSGAAGLTGEAVFDGRASKYRIIQLDCG